MPETLVGINSHVYESSLRRVLHDLLPRFTQSLNSQFDYVSSL